tara:strand:+ start:1417 stop:1665 length:249 start_codon:yes stop_codon:yes gene_type:complete
MNKIKEEDLKLIKEQQTQLAEMLHNVGVLEAQKHGLLHDISATNKDIEDFKEILEKQYGRVNINLENGSYTEIKEDVEDKEN